MSVSFWYFGDPDPFVNQNRDIFIIENTANNPHQLFMALLMPTSRHLATYATNSALGGGGNVLVESQAVLEDGKWFHVVVTSTIPGSKKFFRLTFNRFTSIFFSK